MKMMEDRKKIQEELGRRLKSRRVYLGLKQADVADYIKVHQTFISLIEKGERNSPRIIREMEAYYREMEERTALPE